MENSHLGCLWNVTGCHICYGLDPFLQISMWVPTSYNISDVVCGGVWRPYSPTSPSNDAWSGKFTRNWWISDLWGYRFLLRHLNLQVVSYELVIGRVHPYTK